jgi:hypothetical protein
MFSRVMSNPRKLRRPLFINDEHAVNELKMFSAHTAALYDARVRFERLILRQIETGKYDIAEGRRLWRGWLDHAAALYEKEFGGDSEIRFPEAVRDQAAVEVEEEERVLIGEGSTAAGPLWKGEKPNPIARHPITRIVVHQDARGLYAKAYDDRGWLRSGIGVPGAPVDRAYIERKAAEFWPGVPIEWPNPIARAGYGRRKALNSDLERYYSKCMSGHSAKRFRSKSRRESYCSAVSWKIARNANRYPDYFKGVKSNPLAWYALVLSAIPGRPGYTHVQAEVVDVYADRSEAMKALAREQRKTVGMDNYGMAYAVVRVKQEVSKGMILTVPVKGKKFSFDDAGSMSIKRNPLNPLTRTEYNENPCGCKENPILTDARGVPFEKPERKDYRSDADYMRAFYRYKDSIRDEANRSFNTRFMQAVRRNPLSTPVKAGLAVAGVAFVGALIYAFTKNASANTGHLSFTTDASGNQVIVLVPGDMGSTNVISSASAQNVLDTTVFNLAAPSGGRILNVTSSNANVLSGMMGSTTTSALSLGSANLPGTTLVTVSWTLNGAPVTSTFIVIAT